MRGITAITGIAIQAADLSGSTTAGKKQICVDCDWTIECSLVLPAKVCYLG